MDWKKARKEYLAGGTTYQKISEKYGIPLRSLMRKAKDENWTALKKEAGTRTAQRVADSIADRRADADTLVFDTAVELLAAIRSAVTVLTENEPMYPKSAKDYADAVRAIQQTLDAKPTEADMEEQRARIEKLRKDAQRDDSRSAAVEVVLHGGVMDYGG